MRRPEEGPHRWAVATTACAVLLALVVHFGATLLHVAPSNVLWERHGHAVREYLYPEFRQAWNLFAPDPPEVSLNLHGRVQYQMPDGQAEITDWVNLTAPDLETLRDELLPTRGREQLRKSWSAVRSNWDENEDPVGRWGHDVRRTTVRVALDRISLPATGTALQIQFRTVYTETPPPPWTEAAETPETYHVDHSWWTVDEVMGGAR